MRCRMPEMYKTHLVKNLTSDVNTWFVRFSLFQMGQLSIYRMSEIYKTQRSDYSMVLIKIGWKHQCPLF